MQKSNLAVRLTTAGVAGPLLLLLLFLGPAWAWAVFVGVACAAAAHEFFSMTHPGDGPAQGVGVLSTLGLYAVFYLEASDSRWVLTAVFAVVLVGLMTPLWRLGDIATAGLRTTAGIAGPLYIGGLLASLALLRRDAGDDGSAYVLLALMFAWLGDTGGYFAGRFLGRTKLYPAVSPKKTRAGYVGAIGGSLVGALLGCFWYLPSLPLSHGLALGVFCGSLGPLGDLVESLLKRSTGVKDSGSLIPGHGGILDRIDALLIVSPILYLYVSWTHTVAIAQ